MRLRETRRDNTKRYCPPTHTSHGGVRLQLGARNSTHVTQLRGREPSLLPPGSVLAGSQDWNLNPGLWCGMWVSSLPGCSFTVLLLWALSPPLCLALPYPKTPLYPRQRVNFALPQGGVAPPGLLPSAAAPPGLPLQGPFTHASESSSTKYFHNPEKPLNFF